MKNLFEKIYYFFIKKKKHNYLSIQHLDPTVSLPTRLTNRAADYDLESSHNTVVPARGKTLVSTGLVIVVAKRTYGQITSRSGPALIRAGVIDVDYRGEVKILHFNHSDKDFFIRKGDRISQLILHKITTPKITDVEKFNGTIRHTRGFGSTGISELLFLSTQVLESSHNIIALARGKTLFSTGLVIVVPKGACGQITSKSGLALNYSILVGAGVIDADYRGEVKILLFNHSDKDFFIRIRKRDTIPELIIQKITTPKIKEIEKFNATVRNTSGFGSTEI
ncbi:Deoxyuridine 5'-triphosphate nucleotidohydrolase [Nymphaea thermarum]|nr:Deoxyuridine 5'-triphosphate nucleotidohydrolase [Nymphaea thermarum]